MGLNAEGQNDHGNGGAGNQVGINLELFATRVHLPVRRSDVNDVILLDVVVGGMEQVAVPQVHLGRNALSL